MTRFEFRRRSFHSRYQKLEQNIHTVAWMAIFLSIPGWAIVGWEITKFLVKINGG